MINKILEKINLNKTIEGLLKSKENKYFLIKKENFGIPINLIKKEGLIPVNTFFFIYPVNKNYYLVKLQTEYIEEKEVFYYNNTKIINTVYEYGIPDDYFWVYNIYKFFSGQKKIGLDSNEVYFNISEGIEESKYPKKLLRYNFIQEIIDIYNKNLSTIYRNDIKYLELTEEIFYFKNEKIIKNLIKILEKFGLTGKQKYKDFIKYKDFEKTKKYQKWMKIVEIFKKNKNIYPLLFTYLDSNLDISVFLHNNKEEYHKIFKIYNLDDILSSKIEYSYIVTKGNILLNISLYLYFLEKIFFKTFLRLRDIKKLKINFNEKINLDSLERLPLLMGQLLADNSILIELIKLYNIINNKVILGSKNFILAYPLGNNPENITTKIDNDIKNILKSGEYAKFNDYILNPIEKELFKYNLDFVKFNELINGEI